MESVEFINKYRLFLDEISEVIKPELIPIIDELKGIDPHDLVQPDTFFMSESQGKGFVWNMFIKRARHYSFQKEDKTTWDLTYGAGYAFQQTMNKNFEIEHDLSGNRSDSE